MTSKQSSKYKKFIVGAATAALVASAVAPVASAKDFKDTKGNTHEPAIDALSDAGVITGYPDGSFLPNKTLTRSDVVKLMGKWLVSEGYKVPTDYKTNMRFKDLKPTSNDELLQYAAVVKENGVFNGSNGNLLAGDNITRENMAVVIVRAFDTVEDIELVKYVKDQDFKKDVTDLAKAKAEARTAIDVLDFFDITNPAAPAFNPKATTTRGHFATFLHKSINTDFSEVKAPVVNVDKVAVDAAAEQVKAGAVTVARGNYATDANKLAAVQTYVTSLVTEKDVVAIVVAGKTAGEYVVTLTKGEAKAEKTIAMTFDFTADDLNVTKVESITKTSVKVTLKALAQNETAFTINVLDDKGNAVEVNPLSLEKGETEATFTFKTPLTVDPTGVWVIGAVKYNNDAIKNFSDIVTASKTKNEVTTLAALKKAGLANIVDANITDYVTAINSAATKENLADIQSIIDKANDTTVSAGEAAAAVKAVNDATNQVQLLSALQHKAFARVNASWIVTYKAKVDALALTPATTVAKIQEQIDATNSAAILAANEAATTVATQNAVTELIKLYTVADVTPSTTKAAAVKASEIKAVVFGVKEATTAATVYNALVKVSELDSVKLPATALNANLKAEYLKAKNAAAITGATTVSVLKTAVVTAADTAALDSAADAIVALTETSTAAEVKAALQKLADVTSHTADKFDMTKVNDASLLYYGTALKSLDKVAVGSAALVNAIIADVNGTNNATANLEIVKDASATVAQVRDALTEIASSATSNTVTKAYLNASSQVKLEVAQLVIDNRSKLATPLTAELVIANAVTATYANGVLKSAMADHTDKIAGFNAIGNLAAVSSTISNTKSKLDGFAYPSYTGLTDSQKLVVAEEINKLTKIVDGAPKALNFSGVDKVTTIKQANDYVAAAVAKVLNK
ncbi:S-layer homology domain-containing protein [Sporosarcina sp. FSL K6-5500]|uniref:S-layer homology domain-containing protein n=1 Tax=Sporosarcina sp. FSL K6-5500 TaxID=2921558 RepID=UPI0030F51B68